MKRIHSACLLQTLHFQLKDDIPHDVAVRTVQEEVAHYKAQLERSRTKYKIDEETTQPDGSVMLKVRKQYNTSEVGAYFD